MFNKLKEYLFGPSTKEVKEPVPVVVPQVSPELVSTAPVLQVDVAEPAPAKKSSKARTKKPASAAEKKTSKKSKKSNKV